MRSARLVMMCVCPAPDARCQGASAACDMRDVYLPITVGCPDMAGRPRRNQRMTARMRAAANTQAALKPGCSGRHATAPCANSTGSACPMCAPTTPRGITTKAWVRTRSSRRCGRTVRGSAHPGRSGALGCGAVRPELLRDPFSVLGQEAPTPRRRPRERTIRRPNCARHSICWALCGRSTRWLRSRYKHLAKAHHPDATGGDRSAEEKLKDINQAYSLLKRRVPPRAAAGVQPEAAAAGGSRAGRTGLV